ncbi:MAG: inorganic diphosphatase [Candidatus Paceibacterota bacterium]
MKIKAGKNPPKDINVFIEIPRGSTIKYELDKESGLIKVDRFLHGAMYFPFNYGFVPETHAEDGDPLDVVVIASYPVQSGAMLPSRPIGLLEMEDEAGIDTKIIAVPQDTIDPDYSHVKDIKDLPDHLKAKIKNFFDRYKDLEKGKWVKTNNFLGVKEAYKAITKALQ